MTRDIIIDADHILFFVAMSKTYDDGLDEQEGDWVGDNPVDTDLKPYKKHFKAIIDDYIITAEVESICYNWKIGKTRIVMSDKTNFRYDLYPEYKAKREKKDGVISELAKWARKKYVCEPNTEADDVVAYYVRKGGLGFTTDKDLLKGVAGIWYNTHYQHKCWVRTEPHEAEWFFKCQVLAGDGVDGIPSIAGIGLVTAEKLLIKYGSSWKQIQEIFYDTSKVLGKKHRPISYSKDYFITMTRLVCMSQWTPKKGITLWTRPK